MLKGAKMSIDELKKEEVEERIQEKNTFLISNYLKDQKENEYYSALSLSHTV